MITLIAVAIIEEISAIFAGRIIVLFCLASMPSLAICRDAIGRVKESYDRVTAVDDRLEVRVDCDR